MSDSQNELLQDYNDNLLGVFGDPALVLVEGQGCRVTDADGRRYLDVYNNVVSLGHCHPAVVEAVAAAARRGTSFIGLLYCGLALTSRGLRVVEFNVRFGDPETQAVLARLTSPLAGLLHAAATGRLHEAPAPTWSDDAAVDVVLAAPGYPGEVDRGGRITGVGQALKARKPSLRMIAVEPTASPVLSGGEPGPHKIQGIGANFVPEVLDRELLDEVFTATTEESIKASRDLATQEGLLVGISAGANVSAALKLAERPEFEGKTIVVVLPDFGERYVSTILYEDIRG